MQGPKYNGLGYRAAKLDVRLVPQQLRQLGDVAAIRACPQHTAKLGKPIMLRTIFSVILALSSPALAAGKGGGGGGGGGGQSATSHTSTPQTTKPVGNIMKTKHDTSKDTISNMH